MLLIIALMIVGLLIFVAADRLAQIISAATSSGVSFSVDSSSIIMSTLSTRIGAAFILIFLVKHLAMLYRYNVRLASLYDTRADALQLCGIKSPATLQKLVSSLTAEAIGFDSPPQTLLEEAAILVKKALDQKRDEPKEEKHA